MRASSSSSFRSAAHSINHWLYDDANTHDWADALFDIGWVEYGAVAYPGLYIGFGQPLYLIGVNGIFHTAGLAHPIRAYGGH
eukprot:3695986-Pyramimonas_sp.AAC.1